MPPVFLAWHLAGNLLKRSRGTLDEVRLVCAAFAGVLGLFLALGCAWAAVAALPDSKLGQASRIAAVAVCVAVPAVTAAGARALPVGVMRRLDSRFLAAFQLLGCLGVVAFILSLLHWQRGAGGSAAAWGTAALVSVGIGLTVSRLRPLLISIAAAVVLIGVGIWSWRIDALEADGFQPNPAAGSVALIVLDTVRADALGAHGGPGTPTFDRLANEGTLFEDVISPSPWTIPSHASLFTGFHPRPPLLVRRQALA